MHAEQHVSRKARHLRFEDADPTVRLLGRIDLRDRLFRQEVAAEIDDVPALVVGRRNEICELDDAAEWDLGVAHVSPKRMRECPVQLEQRADHAESPCARPPLVVQLFGEQTRQRGELPREQNGFRGNELSSDRNAGHSLGFGHDLVDAGSGAHFGAARDELLLDRLEHLLVKKPFTRIGFERVATGFSLRVSHPLSN